MDNSGRTCVIYNPSAGRGRAARQFQVFQRTQVGEVAYRPTERAGDAIELARNAAEEGYGIIAAAGGDGTVHEVGNGLLQAASDAALAIVPLGSANDYHYSLQQQFRGSHDERRVDVGLVRDERGRQRYFLGSLGLGFNGMVTIEARKIRRLRGLPLYALATLRALRTYQTGRMTISFDDGPPIEQPTLMLSTMLGRREGNFLMAPQARLDDGWFDFVRTGPVRWWSIVRLLPKLAWSGPPQNHPQVQLGQCRRAMVKSEAPLAVHTDGEVFCRPEDAVHSLEIELLPQACRVRFPFP